MNIFLNGEARSVEDGLTPVQILERFSMPTERIAIELNKEVLRKKDWSGITIKEADVIEIVHFVGGG